MLTKTHATKQTNYARKCLDDLWCICIWFWVFRNEVLYEISLNDLSMKLRVLRSQELDQRKWESVIFIDIENRASEKTILPLKSPFGGFIRRSGPQNKIAVLNPRGRGTNGDHIRWFPKPPIRNQKWNRPKISNSAVSFDGHDRRLNRRIKTEN